MRPPVHATAENGFASLRRLAQRGRAANGCEFCSAPLGVGHRHLLEVGTRKIICACDSCALRFENVVGRWKLIPRDGRALPAFKMSEEAWDALALPIQLAFFFHHSGAKRVVAMYPSPAGATESLLPLTDWERLAGANPCLAGMETDVEALLVKRCGAVPEYYIIPIDRCYDLNIASAKYLYALEGGEVPLLFLFSGSVFFTTPAGRLQTERVSWNAECVHRMPVRTWRNLMEQHYPNSGWLTLEREVFERLCAYKRRQGLATWEQAITQLLPPEAEELAERESSEATPLAPARQPLKAPAQEVPA